MPNLESHLKHQLEHGQSLFFWHRLRWLAVTRHLPRQDHFRLLDIGAGAGFAGSYLAHTHPQAEYFFCEPLEPLARHLESVYGKARNLTAAPSYSGFPTLTALDVLEHQKDDLGFLTDLVNRMDPGACLILTVPALQSLWSKWDEALGHVRRYRKTDLAGLFKRLPVEVEELSYLFPEMLAPALVRKLTKGAGDADFPNLPPLLNETLYRLGTASLALRRFHPFGTSLLAVLRKERAP